MNRELQVKAALYGIPLFFGPFADKIGSILFQDKWPSIPMVVGCTLLGVISACIGLRAYTDGSYERGKPNWNGNGNGTPPAATVTSVKAP